MNDIYSGLLLSCIALKGKNKKLPYPTAAAIFCPQTIALLPR